MARTAVRADDTFLFGFGKNVHHWFETCGPVALGEAVHKNDVEMVGAEFFAEAVEIGAHFRRGARPGLGEDSDFAAIDVLESFSYVGMAAVGIGGIEKAQAVVVAVLQQERQT